MLSQVGIVDALIAYYSDRNGGALTLIDGHLRKEDYPGEWPVLVTDLDDREADLLLVSLDPLAAMADTAADRLRALTDGLGEDLGETLRDQLSAMADEAQARLDAMRPPLVDPGDRADKAAELQTKWQVQRGQIWQVGRHRVMCGDSTSAEDVGRLMGGEKAVLFATDPPYLVDYDGTNHPHKWSEPDKNKDWSGEYDDWDSSEQGEALYEGFISVALEVAIVEDAAWYCWHASRNQAMLERIWEENGAFVHQQIVWVKDRPVLTRSWYMWQHEPCFFGWIRGKKPKRIADDYPPTVWQIPTIAPGTETLHPTSKPVELFAIPMRQHTVAGDICYEPFAGSGSQFVAAEQLGRLCYGLEKNPGFVGVTLERLADMGLEPRIVEE